MNIDKDLEIVDLALKYKDTLIIGDMQLGYETELIRKGFLIPRFQFKEIKQRLEKIFKQVKVKKIILNGDIKHSFGDISDQEWREILELIDYLTSKGELIFVKGNHDTILQPIADKRNIKMIDYYNVDNLSILHGHVIIPDLRDVIIIGHEHPAISFKQRRGDKFKCFLKGKWHNKTIIVLPSFSTVTEGSDITREQQLSPFLQGNLDNFEVYIVEDKIYYFGKLKDIEKL